MSKLLNFLGKRKFRIKDENTKNTKRVIIHSDKLLHIYGQKFEGDDVTIISTEEALKRLVGLLLDAQVEKGGVAQHFCDANGEEYDINILISDDLSQYKLPYKEV